MKKRQNKLAIAVVSLASLVLFITPALSHHSFAMYDQTKTITMTGVMTRFVAQANHAELHFVPLGPDGKPMRNTDGKPIQWGVEMAGAAAVANQGITATSFAAGTIFSVKLNPLREVSDVHSERLEPVLTVKCLGHHRDTRREAEQDRQRRVG